jgi:hypothetical protein
MREFLIALYLYASDHHTGQGCPWYKRSCLASRYLSRWYQITDPYEWLNLPFVRDKCKEQVVAIYIKLEVKYGNNINPIMTIYGWQGDNKELNYIFKKAWALYYLRYTTTKQLLFHPTDALEFVRIIRESLRTPDLPEYIILKHLRNLQR